MPDHDDIPDPMDEAYLSAEQALDDTAAREARRARVLAAVSLEPAAAASARRPVRRYGGWLAAACVAGLSIWTAQRVYRSTPPPQQGAQQGPSAAVSPPAPPAPLVSPAPDTAISPASRAQPPALRAAPRASAVASAVIPRGRLAPPPDIAPPSPLPIPPVEKPIQAPPPAAPAPIASFSANAPAPAPPPAPQVAAKAGAAEPAPNNTVQSVVITGSRMERRDNAASTQAISKPLAEVSDARSKMLEARSKALGARLRYDAAAGRIADIEPVLAEGVTVDAVDEDGETALMKSIQTGQSEAAALLRRHGANLDLKTLSGVSARDMAADKHDPKLDRALGITPSAATPP